MSVPDTPFTPPFVLSLTQATEDRREKEVNLELGCQGVQGFLDLQVIDLLSLCKQSSQDRHFSPVDLMCSTEGEREAGRIPCDPNSHGMFYFHSSGFARLTRCPRASRAPGTQWKM